MNSPARFFAFCKKVQHSLTGNPNVPESLRALLQQYFDKMDPFEAIYHQSLDGGRSLIRDRERFTEEMIVLLDQIASVLESALILNPDALKTTGFTITQDRRNTTRVKLPMPIPMDFNVTNEAEPGRALGTASNFPGSLVCEVHINQKDPAFEGDWFHNAICPDAKKMAMQNIAAGNTFLRMRYQGPDGPGPWSGIVNLTIT